MRAKLTLPFIIFFVIMSLFGTLCKPLFPITEEGEAQTELPVNSSISSANQTDASSLPNSRNSTSANQLKFTYMYGSLKYRNNPALNITDEGKNVVKNILVGSLSVPSQPNELLKFQMDKSLSNTIYINPEGRLVITDNEIPSISSNQNGTNSNNPTGEDNDVEKLSLTGNIERKQLENIRDCIARKIEKSSDIDQRCVDFAEMVMLREKDADPNNIYSGCLEIFK